MRQEEKGARGDPELTWPPPPCSDQGAVYWWGLAAQGGCSKAMFNLAMEGARGWEGQGARVSERWLRSAAEAVSLGFRV